MLVVLLDQLNHDLAGEGDREADPHAGLHTPVNALGRHKRADQEPPADAQKVAVPTHLFLYVGYCVSYLDDAVLGPPETEHFHYAFLRLAAWVGPERYLG